MPGPVGELAHGGHTCPLAAVRPVPVSCRPAGYPGASARSRDRLCANSSCRGNTEDNDTQILRTLTCTTAATFSSSARIVPH